MFFFSRNKEVFPVVKKIPFVLRCAAKLPSAGTLQTIAFVMIVISGIGIVVALITLRYEFDMRSYGMSDFDLAAHILRVATWIGLLILSVVAIYVIEKLEMHQHNIVNGYHRSYYMTAGHHSYDLVFSPLVRELIADTSSDAHKAVMRIVSDPMVIETDKFIFEMDAGLEDQGEFYERAVSLINFCERALAPLGTEFEEYFEQKREEVVLTFKDDMGGYQALINKFTKNIDMLTA